jgi:hypothetical protein
MAKGRSVGNVSWLYCSTSRGGTTRPREAFGMSVIAGRSNRQAVVTTDAEERAARAIALYEQFGRPLESAHTGEFVAITPDGRTLLGPTLVGTVEDAAATFGPGSFVFKVGDVVVGAWR